MATTRRITTNPRYIGLVTDEKPTEGIENGAELYQYEIRDTNECGHIVAKYKFYDGCWHEFYTQIAGSDGKIVDFQTYQQGDVDFVQSLNDIIFELKKMNLQLSLITGKEISHLDIDMGE